LLNPHLWDPLGQFQCSQVVLPISSQLLPFFSSLFDSRRKVPLKVTKEFRMSKRHCYVQPYRSLCSNRPRKQPTESYREDSSESNLFEQILERALLWTHC